MNVELKAIGVWDSIKNALGLIISSLAEILNNVIQTINNVLSKLDWLIPGNAPQIPFVNFNDFINSLRGVSGDKTINVTNNIEVNGGSSNAATGYAVSDAVTQSIKYGAISGWGAK
jgi:hypothetical protein